jgi:membrane protease YdiL (CAAX protease family)
MTQPDQEIHEGPRRGIQPARFAMAVTAWCVIICAVAAALIWPRSPDEKTAEAGANDALNLLLMRAQARYVIGVRDLMPGFMGENGPGADTRQIYAQAKALDTGPIGQRLRFVVVAGELKGADEALNTLDEFDKLIARVNEPLTGEQKAQHDILRKLYTDYRRLQLKAPTVTDDDKERLRKDFGWFGDLALAPAGRPGLREPLEAVAGGAAAADIDDQCPNPQARAEVLAPTTRVVVTALTAVGAGFGGMLLGSCGLLVLGVLLLLGKLRGGLMCGITPAGVYAETFALWMLFFAALSLALRDFSFGKLRLLVGGLAMLLSLAVLVWPVVRGVPWRQVREDLGWTLGRRGAAEPIIGLGCYILTFPLLFVGLAIVLILTFAQNLLTGGPTPDDLVGPITPSHPIVGPLARGDWEIRLQIFFLASIVAPIVEETMFRGVLYRHLRELTDRFGALVSVICSGLISSFIFAVIHPQGLLAVPVLMALAFGFVLAREWRCTLIPSMVAHGVNNGLVMMMGILMLGD